MEDADVACHGREGCCDALPPAALAPAPHPPHSKGLLLATNHMRPLVPVCRHTLFASISSSTRLLALSWMMKRSGSMVRKLMRDAGLLPGPE